jgi:hypothetical protein
MSMKIAVVMGVGVLLGLGGYLYLQSSDEEGLKSLAGSEYVNTVSSDGNDYSAEALSQMAPEKLMDMQKVANADIGCETKDKCRRGVG